MHRLIENALLDVYDASIELDHTILWRTASVSVPLLRAEIEVLLNIEPVQASRPLEPEPNE